MEVKTYVLRVGGRGRFRVRVCLVGGLAGRLVVMEGFFGLLLQQAFQFGAGLVAEASFERPTLAVPWRIWRCRLVTSTTSSSTTPKWPTPAAAR